MHSQLKEFIVEGVKNRKRCAVRVFAYSKPDAFLRARKDGLLDRAFACHPAN